MVYLTGDQMAEKAKLVGYFTSSTSLSPYSWHQIVGIDHPTLPLKFGVLRQNIYEDIQQAILAARFYLKIVSKSALHVHFSPFKYFFHIFWVSSERYR